MAKARRNPDRENRIYEEIIVDACGLEEQARVNQLEQGNLSSQPYSRASAIGSE